MGMGFGRFSSAVRTPGAGFRFDGVARGGRARVAERGRIGVPKGRASSRSSTAPAGVSPDTKFVGDDAKELNNDGPYPRASRHFIRRAGESLVRFP